MVPTIRYSAGSGCDLVAHSRRATELVRGDHEPLMQHTALDSDPRPGPGSSADRRPRQSRLPVAGMKERAKDHAGLHDDPRDKYDPSSISLLK